MDTIVTFSLSFTRQTLILKECLLYFCSSTASEVIQSLRAAEAESGEENSIGVESERAQGMPRRGGPHRREGGTNVRT